MIYWCFLLVMINENGTPTEVETAVKGRLMTRQNNTLFINFSEYANQKGYLGNWEFAKKVKDENCIRD